MCNVFLSTTIFVIMGIHEGQCFWNVSFCQVHRHIGEELRLELRTFISISLRWEVLVNCEKFASMVCVAVLNRLKIRMNNMDSEVFCFLLAWKSKQTGKNILRPIYITQILTLGALIIFGASYFIFPHDFFPCCFHFFSSLLRVFFF